MPERLINHMGPLQLFKVKWHWGDKTDAWLKTMSIGRTLNWPCGLSTVGDERWDITPSVKPDRIMDLMKAEGLEKQSFDTVICDPPFSYYSHFKWLLPIVDLARKRVILSTPQICYPLKHFKFNIYATRYTGSFYIRTWVVYDRMNLRLDHSKSLLT